MGGGEGAGGPNSGDWIESLVLCRLCAIDYSLRKTLNSLSTLVWSQLNRYPVINGRLLPLYNNELYFKGLKFN
jgi:hypothetical protein